MPFPDAIRAPAEKSLGMPLGHARLHASPAAAGAADALDARAFTVGRDVYFGREALQAPSRDFDRLAAHELTHVAQAQPGRATREEVSSPGEAHEREASSAADAIVAGRPFQVHERAEAGAVHRVPKNADEKKPVESNLPTGMLLDQAMTRLESDDYKWAREVMPPLESLYTQLLKDAAGFGDSDELLRPRVRRLNEILDRAAPAVKALRRMDDKESYLPGVAETIVARVELVLGEFGAALVTAYSDLLIDKSLFEQADKDLLGLSDFIAQQYLGPKGIAAFGSDVKWTIQKIIDLRGAAGRPVIVRSSDKPVSEPLLDDILQISFPKGQQLSHTVDLRLTQLKAEKDKTKLAERMDVLVGDLQGIALLAQAALTYEQFAYWKAMLDKHPVLDTPSQKPTCDKWMTKLNEVIVLGETAWRATDPKRYSSLIGVATSTLGTYLALDEFKNDAKAIQDRLSTIETILVLGKVALITAAAGLFAGVAATAVAAAVETAGGTAALVGAAEFGAEALAFTAASRLGQEIAFGKAEGTFLGDLATNALMMGALKTATLGYGKLFKAFADPTKYKVAFGAGKAFVGLATMQMFAEAEHAIVKGQVMSGDERARSIVQNVVLFGALEAAGFITRPIHDRIGADIAKAFGLDQRFSGDLAKLQTQQTDLRKQLEDLKRSSSPDPKDIESLLRGLTDLWQKELGLLERGRARHAITEEQHQTAVKNYADAGARLELQLATLGIAGPGGEKATFQPIEQGVVSFQKGAEETLEKFYTDRGGSVKRNEDGTLEGRLPSGEVTFYIPAGEVPKKLASMGERAKARDTATREATSDPFVEQGLKNLANLMGPRNADAVLAASPDVVALLSALGDPGFNKTLGTPFYLRFATEPWAIDFARSYGGDVLTNLYRRYLDWDVVKDAVGRATQQLENVATPEARKELLEALRNTKDTAKLDALLEKPAPPKPPKPAKPTKKSMGVDRSASSWKVFRAEEQKFADQHGETLTDEQLDLRADLKQTVKAARAGKFGTLGHASKQDILGRFDKLAAEAGMPPSWISGKRGDLAEALFNPDYGKQHIYLKGTKVATRVSGSSVADYAEVHTGFTEWWDLKSDLIDQGTKQADGSYDAGVKAASTYAKDAKADADNFPSGDKISIQFIRDPGPVTRKRMAQILFGSGAVYRVKFGDSPPMDKVPP